MKNCLTRTDEAVEYTRKKRMQWLNRKSIRENEEVSETPVLTHEKLIDLFQVTLELHITELYIRHTLPRVCGGRRVDDELVADIVGLIEDNLPYQMIESLSWECYDRADPVFLLKNTEQVACMMSQCLAQVWADDIAKLLTPSTERFLIETLDRMVMEID
jgi:hypothetical protein